jgi:hypothetical protein
MFARALPVFLLFVVLAGCGQEPVREDRAANWSRGGDTVTFQHDEEGVFVAGKDGQGLTRIFVPDASVLATSRPLYSPTDGRLIFTTAYDPSGQPRSVADNLPALAEGKTVFQQPVRYTCWLRDEAAGDEQPEPGALFQASSEHIGYVSAGLAVRWHPDGQRVMFVDVGQDGDHRHGVFEFDLRTKRTRSVFPHRADGVIFDFSPGGSHLVCVAGFAGDVNDGAQFRKDVAGIWIGNADDSKSWLKVAGTERLATGELPSLIEGLRASRPAWTDDDKRFASVASLPSADPNLPGKSLLQTTQFTRRDGRQVTATTTIHEIEGTFADLCWSRDGRKLGFIERRNGAEATLRIYEHEGELSEPVDSRGVRRFAGFDSTGTNLAYVVADESGLSPAEQEWNFILMADRLARDTVVVREIVDPSTGRDVFSGMRVTFPVWSPQENRLSLWLTFSPRYRSLFSILFRWGLWPGDPAATLDLSTGDVAWMAVSPAEEMQVGHYYLLRRDYARAWEWYEKANAKLPARRAPRDLNEFVNMLGSPDRSHLFEYHCLKQLGRDADAQARLEDFEQTFYPASAVDAPQPGLTLDEILRQFGAQAELLKYLLHDLYIAEVFLSLDAPDAGVALFQEQLAHDSSESQRLSRQLALAQILLAAGRRDEYLAVCSQQIAPLAWQMWKGEAAARAGNDKSTPANATENFVLPIVGGLSLLPLAYPEFLAAIPDETLREALAAWQARRQEVTQDSPALSIDLFLRAAHLTLGNADESRESEERIKANPMGQSFLGGKPVVEALQEFRMTGLNPWQRQQSSPPPRVR